MILGEAKLGGRPAGPGKPAAGMTITELLVSVAVLVILIMVFNLVLHQARGVVTGSQAKMRANSEIASIIEIMRVDLQRASRNGFLCITQAPDGTPQLFLATAGPACSLTTTETGTGTIAAYGLCNVDADGRPLLWRASWVLTGATGTADPERDVFYGTDFANLQILNREDISKDSVIDALRSSASYVPRSGSNGLPVPPATLSDVGMLWKYLATNCTELSILWADGSTNTDGEVWFGPACTVDPDGTVPPQGPVAKDDNWGSNDVNTPGAVEFRANDGRYRAMWTRHNQNNWPKAIKIRFRLTDPSLPAEFQGAEYEAICTVGR